MDRRLRGVAGCINIELHRKLQFRWMLNGATFMTIGGFLVTMSWRPESRFSSSILYQFVQQLIVKSSGLWCGS